MTRTTIMLPDDLKSQSQQLARKLGISLSELIRQSLQRELRRRTPEPATDPLFVFDDVWEGDSPTDGALNHDDYLYGDDN